MTRVFSGRSGYSEHKMLTRLLTALALAALLLLGVGSVGVSASVQTDAEEETETEEAETDPAVAAELKEGSEVYSQTCAGCHQPGGTGLAGQFPPLIDNPNVDDAAYVADVIANGKDGPITVNGELFDAVMPPFSLSESDASAVIAYIQNDFMVPAGAAVAVPGGGGPVAGSSLPFLADTTALLAYLIAAAVAALVLAPRLVGANNRFETPWLDAWLKSALIVVAVAILIVIIPNMVLTLSSVTTLGRFYQDLIGVAVWGVGLSALLAGLWWAHRESRV